MENPKNQRTALRNKARKRYRVEHPKHIGKKLKTWPITVKEN